MCIQEGGNLEAIVLGVARPDGSLNFHLLLRFCDVIFKVTCELI